MYDLSIIIPYYHSEKYLKKNFFLYKKISKENSEIELIFVNDRSKDNLYNYLKNFFLNRKNTNLLNLRKNSGPGIARNRGLIYSKGKRIFFLDSDDYLNINNLKLLLNKYKKSNKNIFFNYKKNNNFKNNFKKISKKDDHVERLKKYFTKSVDLECLYICYNKKFLMQNKIFFKKGVHEDVYFMFLVFVNMKQKIEKFNKIVYLKNKTTSSITSHFGIAHLQGWIGALKNIYDYLKNKKRLKKELSCDFQYRLRGEYFNLIKKIEKSTLKDNIKLKYKKMVHNKLVNLIDLNFENNNLKKTKKDLATFKMIKKFSNEKKV